MCDRCGEYFQNSPTLTYAKGVAMLSMEVHFFLGAHLWDWLVDRSLLVYLLQPQTISQNSPQPFLQPMHEQEENSLMFFPTNKTPIFARQ